MTAGHARAVLASSDPVTLARQVIDQNLSVRQAEALAKKAGSTSAGQGPRAKAPGHAGGKDADTLALENDLSEALGLTVDILDRDGAGEIRIHYATLEQLDEVCRRLSKH
jgi:ParB family chromosome partitioning protein